MATRSTEFHRGSLRGCLCCCCFHSLACYTLTAVEHPCPKCGEAVEDGVPFCRHCRAPQIRVVLEPSVEPLVHPQQPRDRSDVPIPTPVFAPEMSRSLGQKVDWSHGLPCAAMAGVASLFLSLVPYALFGPAFLLGGAFSVYLYRRRTKSNPTRAMGALLGAASGGFGFLFSAVITVATVVYTPDKVREAMTAQLKASHYDAEAVKRVMDIVNSPEGLAFFVAFTLFVAALIFIIGASVGGAWYSAWVQKRNRE